MPKMLRDAAGNLYGWNDTMAKMTGIYTIVDEDGGESVPLAEVRIGLTEVVDYVPGQEPPEPSFVPPQVTEVQPTPDNPVAVAKPAATPSAASSKKVKKKKDPDEVDYDTDADGGGFGAE